MKKTITLIDILAAAIGFPLAQCLVALFLSHDWGLARAIAEQMVDTLFGPPEPSLLVELPGGERVWVISWSDTDPSAPPPGNNHTPS